jgi:N-acetylneuraminic acid mutarotase
MAANRVTAVYALARVLVLMAALTGCATGPAGTSGSTSANASESAGASALASAERETVTWVAVDPMSAARVMHSATVLRDGKVLVAGGFSNGEGAGPLASAELFDPTTGSWTRTGDMLQARAGHTATLLPDDRVLIAGGGTSPAEVLASAELYDPDSGAWTATGPMLAARGSHTATLLNDGTVLVAGGADGVAAADITASAERYDPATGAWTAAGSMTESRTLHVAALLSDGTVLVAGGLDKNGRGLASAERYDPANATWVATGPMSTVRVTHAAATLADGRVLVVGGLSGGFGGDLVPSDILASAEVYDLISSRWTATGSMATPRFNFPAVALLDGDILVEAGDTLGRGPLESAERYDPGTATWIATGDVVFGRAAHLATLLNDGRVLLTGGEGPGARGLSFAEVFESEGGR